MGTSKVGVRVSTAGLMTVAAMIVILTATQAVVTVIAIVIVTIICFFPPSQASGL